MISTLNRPCSRYKRFKSVISSSPRADGFKFVPPKAVDWLVCDMVEKPFRIAELTRRWMDQGWARRALVNLKLPMKQRVVELERCLNLFTGLEVRCKQLYHDREEVTMLVLA